MNVIQVPDMKCEMCVKRITKALGPIVPDLSVSLQEKLVQFGGPAALVPVAKAALEKLGFSPKTA